MGRSFTRFDAAWLGLSVALIAVLANLFASSAGPNAGARDEPTDGPPTPLAVATAPLQGGVAIAALQAEVAEAAHPRLALEQLGWAFVERAHTKSDPGFFRLAEQCAQAMDDLQPGGDDAALLRGHALHGLHRFDEAAEVALALAEQRGSPADFGLLGDVWVDVGRYGEAADAYQAMMDLRPDAEAYARAAHLRWLTGDLEGAIEAIAVAARAVSPRSTTTHTWIWSRLALYELQVGALDEALESSDRALRIAPGSGVALHTRGRVLLATGRAGEAVDLLERAAIGRPLPDVLWTLSEALAEAGEAERAAAVAEQLRTTGASIDPRGTALYLATAGIEPDRALALARAELERRPDPYSHDALAWAAAAKGDIPLARRHTAAALAAQTPDPRLHLHAGLIALRAGTPTEASAHLARATRHHALLLPSERRLLAATSSEPSQDEP